MAPIQSTTIQREVVLSVLYIEEPAEKDIGHPNSVEIYSVLLNGVQVTLTKEQHDSIREEIVEQVYS